MSGPESGAGRSAGSSAALAIQHRKEQKMSIKLKALGVSLFAWMALSAFAVMNASAESQATGHFTSSVHHTIVDFSKNLTHDLEFGVEGLTGIICDTAEYTSTFTGTTVTQIDSEAVYGSCHTTGGSPGEVGVTLNGCTYRLTQPNKNSATTEHTFDLVCPAGKVVEIHHPSCTMTIPSQNGLKGVGYSTTVESGKHAITFIATVKVPGIQFHGGICNLLGTIHSGAITGSATVKGTNTAKESVDITATGSVS